MKKIYITLIISLYTLSLFSQLDRSKAPEGAAMKKVEFGKPSRFTLPNGLQVLVVENHKQPIVSFSLSLDYTPFMEGDITGNSNIAGELLKCGTKSRSKAMIDEDIDFIGATLRTYDKGIWASSLSKHTEKVVTIMSDVLLNPTFPIEPLENIKNQKLTELMANKEEPDAISDNIASSALFGEKHPFGEIVTEKTIQNISQKSCSEFYKTYFKPNIATLVIVGDITTEQAETLAKKYFSKWKRGKVATQIVPQPEPFNANMVAIAHKEGSNQSTIAVTYSLDLKPNSPDRIKARVMNEILGGGSFQAKLFQNLREKHAYTYGAYSQLSTNKYVGKFEAQADVRAAITDSAFTEIIKEMTALATDTVTEAELQLVKNSIAGSFGRSLESPETIARFELDIIRNNLSPDFYATYLQQLEAVTKEDVQAMAKKYLKPNNALLIAVGDSALLTKLLINKTAAGNLHYYNAEGKKIK